MTNALKGYSINYELSFRSEKAVKSVQKAEKAFGLLRKVLATVVSGKIVRESAKFGQEMSLMADRTGMSVSKLSSLRNAFVATGSSAGKFSSVIDEINNGLLGLSMGDGALASKLAMFGISPMGANGLKSAKDILYDLSDWAKSQKGVLSEQDILFRLQSLFGIDTAYGKRMLGGSAALKQYEKEKEAAMGVVSPEESEKLTELNNKLNELWQTLGNTASKAVASVSEKLVDFINYLEKIVKLGGDFPELTAAIGALATVIGGAGGLKLAIGGLSGALGALGSVLLPIVGGLGAFGVGAAIGDWLGSEMGGEIGEGISRWFGPASKMNNRFNEITKWAKKNKWYDKGATERMLKTAIANPDISDMSELYAMSVGHTTDMLQPKIVYTDNRTYNGIDYSDETEVSNASQPAPAVARQIQQGGR